MSKVSLLALAFVLVFRPMKSGVTLDYTNDAVFGVALLVSAVAWAAMLVLDHERSAVLKLPVAFLAVFLVICGLSVFSAAYRFPALHSIWVMSTYGLLFFLVIQHWQEGTSRELLCAAALATAATVAAYAVLHYFFYMPAMVGWLHRDPDHFRKMFDANVPFFKDIVARITTRRATGNFITSNQLADFLILGVFFSLFVLIANRRKRSGRFPHVAVAASAAIVLSIVALVLTKSKGGLISFAFAVVVFLLAWAGVVVLPRIPFKRKVLVLGGACTLCLLFIGVVAYILFVSDSSLSRKMRASFGVRLGYWQTTLKIIKHQPLLGVGPGNWPDHYAFHKLPGHEETKIAHNDYLQIASESGVFALAAYVAFLVSALVVPFVYSQVSKGRIRNEPDNAREDKKESLARRNGDAAGSRSYLDPKTGTILGIVIVALAFLLDYHLFYSIPELKDQSSAFGRARALHYVGLFVIWAAVFAAVMLKGGAGGLSGERTERRHLLPAVALVAALAGFMLHSAAEFCLAVGAIGTMAFFIIAVIVAQYCPRSKKWTPAVAPRLILFGLLGLGTVILCLTMVRPVITFAGNNDAVDYNRKYVLASVGSAPEAMLRLEESIRFLEEASEAIPIEAETFHKLGLRYVKKGEILYAGGRRAESDAAFRASLKCFESAWRLNPLKSKYYMDLGTFFLGRGKPDVAAELYFKGASRTPSKPQDWFVFAHTAAQNEGLSERVCRAYERALELSPKQYHERNRLSSEQENLARRALAGCRPKAARSD